MLSAAAVALTATPALAHAELIASSPAENASLAAPPAKITLTFDSPVTLAANPIEIIGPGNATWQVGKPAVAGAVVSAPVVASGPAGPYTLVYRVVSDDGDAVTGSVPFTMAAAATTTTATTTTTEAPAETTTEPPFSTSSEPAAEPAADESGGGTLLWIWLLGGAVLLAAIVVVTLRVRRSGR
jgi:methionine-rich copper-binding protein CopC